MFIKLFTLAAAMLATGIETAFVPSDDGGGEYLVRVGPRNVGTLAVGASGIKYRCLGC